MNMENMKTEETKNQLKNLFGKLTKDSKSLFCLVEKINRNVLNKAWKSVYEKDKVYYKLYNEIENRDTIFDEEDEKIPFRASFIEQKKGIDRSSTLCSIKAPFESFHADIANIKFLSKSVVDLDYCLLCVDLFSSKIYTYPMKRRGLLAKKHGVVLWRNWKKKEIVKNKWGFKQILNSDKGRFKS